MTTKVFKLCLFFVCISVMGCKKESGNDDPDNLDNYYVDVTFEGATRHCKQFNSSTSDEGTLIGGCVFYGDNMAITFGGTNYLDATKTNGFNGAFAVGDVTHAGVYSFREADLDINNETSLVQRFKAGPSLDSWEIWDNDENLRRYESGGSCRDEDLAVGVQEIDITKYSSENGGIIEGTFYMTVYETPDGCFNDIPHIITGVFRCKRINIE